MIFSLLKNGLAYFNAGVAILKSEEVGLSLMSCKLKSKQKLMSGDYTGLPIVPKLVFLV
jgi:hypothetical protein